MKKTFFHLFVFVIAYNSCTTANDTKPNIGVNAAPNAVAEPHAIAKPNANATVDIKNTIYIKNNLWLLLKQAAPVIQSAVQSTARTIADKTGTLTHDIKTVIKKHKIKLSAAAIACLYGVLLFKLWQANHKLNQTQSWALWKKDVALTSLIAIPQQDLASQLIIDAKTRYTNQHNMTDPISPLVAFMKDIEQEIKQTKQHIKLRQRIKTLHIEKLFPIKAKLEKLEEKLQRLLYLKNLLISWLTNYTLEQKKILLETAHECKNPYELFETLLLSGQKLKKKNLAIDVTWFATKNFYRIAKFLVRAGFTVEEKATGLCNLKCLQSIKRIFQ